MNATNPQLHAIGKFRKFFKRKNNREKRERKMNRNKGFWTGVLGIVVLVLFSVGLVALEGYICVVGRRKRGRENK